MFNVRYEITVPSTFGENAPADMEFVNSCLAHVESAMNGQFGACTSIDARGNWNNDESVTVKEPVILVYSLATESTFDSWQFMLDLAEWVKLTMLQSCVLIAEYPVSRSVLV